MSEFLSFTNTPLAWNGVLLQADFSASHLQQCIERFPVSHVAAAYKMLKEFKSLVSEEDLLHTLNQADPCYLVLPDAIQGNFFMGRQAISQDCIRWPVG